MIFLSFKNGVDDVMIKIIKQEINHELKNKVEWSCKLNSTKPIFINGNLLKLKPNNIGYIEKLLTIGYIFYSMDTDLFTTEI